MYSVYKRNSSSASQKQDLSFAFEYLMLRWHIEGTPSYCLIQLFSPQCNKSIGRSATPRYRTPLPSSLTQRKRLIRRIIRTPLAVERATCSSICIPGADSRSRTRSATSNGS